MKIKQLVLAAGMATALVAGSASVAGAAETTTSADPAPAPAPAAGRADRCLPDGADDAWPAEVQGRPDGFEAGDAGGVYMWHDADGWHLRVTHRQDDKAVFRGQIVTRGTVRDVHAVRDEAGDKVRTGGKAHVIRFSFANHGQVDGLDFHTTCAPALRLELGAGGKHLPASRVFLGHAAVHPDSNPYTIRRTA
jgi:hypothetical protein